MAPRPIVNPFSARYIRPGAIPFLDQDNTLDGAIEKFKSLGFVGQIVGPHGCGKSCLAIAIAKSIRTEFDTTRYISIRNANDIVVTPTKESGTESQVTDFKTKKGRQLLIVDGLERISRLHQWLLKKSRFNMGLLVTSHVPIRGLPIIHQIDPNIDTLCHVVDTLCPEHSFSQPFLSDVFNRNEHNIRESLMQLYDEFQDLKSNDPKHAQDHAAMQTDVAQPHRS